MVHWPSLKSPHCELNSSSAAQDVGLKKKKRSRHRTSTWQSSLCRDLFVDLLVGNARGNVELPLQVSVCCTICEQSKRRQRSLRFIKFSSNRDNAWFHTSAVAMLQVSGRCQNYQAVGRFPTILNNNHNIEGLTWCCEELLKELNSLSRWERLKALPWIPKLWRELNQKMTLNWETSLILPTQVLP